MTDLTLADGRTLDARVVGPDGAPALVYFHGTPGSSLVLPRLEAGALARGLRVVSWARPGYAGSTRARGRTVASVVDDAVEVLDRLGIDTAVTAGWSGGGPHTLACGALRPDRFRAVAVIAGVAPYAESAGTLDWMAGMGEENVEEFGAALKGEEATSAYLVPQRPVYEAIRPDEIVAAMETLLPEADRAYCTDEFGEFLAASFRAAVSTGMDGWLDDDLAFAAPWGFDLGAVAVPVSVWQGSEDLMVPFAHGSWLVDAVPGARGHLLEGEGHLTIAVGAVDGILDELVELGRG